MPLRSHTFIVYALRLPVLALCLLACGRTYAADVSLCPKVIVRSAKPLKFSGTERELICGSPNVAAWRDVPAAEAKLFMTSFLQSRGFHHPTYHEEGDHVVVDTGEETLVSVVTARGAPSTLDVDRYWKPLGAPLTPKVLSDLERWTEHELQTQGYPCPTVHSRADPNTGQVLLLVEPGQSQTISSVKEEQIPGLDAAVLRRYDAFKIGESFDADLLTLTADRALGDQIVLSSTFTEPCEANPVNPPPPGKGVTITQKVLPGPPRVVTYGFGFNTEKLLMAQATAQNTRLGHYGSSLNLNLSVSYLQQSLTASANVYYLPFPARSYLKPVINLLHQNEKDYELSQADLELMMASSYESAGAHAAYWAGPALHFIRTTRDISAAVYGGHPAVTHLVSLDTHFDMMSHAYELGLKSPHDGYTWAFDGAFASRRILSDISAKQLRLNGEKLWNLRGLDPPIWIFGVRAHANTTLTSTDIDSLRLVPPDFRYWLGGIGNLRGFAHRSIPSGNFGSLTSIDESNELRIASILPFNIQPLGFVDLGSVGSAPLSLKPILYWSPGAGVRWESPIGPVRATLARGLVWDDFGLRSSTADQPKGHWQFYFSYGEEF